jgi:hypothetical protein
MSERGRSRQVERTAGAGSDLGPSALVRGQPTTRASSASLSRSRCAGAHDPGRRGRPRVRARPDARLGRAAEGLHSAQRRARSTLVAKGLLRRKQRRDRSQRIVRPPGDRGWRENLGDREWFHPQEFWLTPLGDAVVRVYADQLETAGQRIRWDVPRLRQEIVERSPGRCTCLGSTGGGGSATDAWYRCASASRPERQSQRDKLVRFNMRRPRRPPLGQDVQQAAGRARYSTSSSACAPPVQLLGAPRQGGLLRCTLTAGLDDDRRRDGRRTALLDDDRMRPGRQRVQERHPAVPDGQASRSGRQPEEVVHR